LSVPSLLWFVAASSPECELVSIGERDSRSSNVRRGTFVAEGHIIRQPDSCCPRQRWKTEAAIRRVLLTTQRGNHICIRRWVHRPREPWRGSARFSTTPPWSPRDGRINVVAFTAGSPRTISSAIAKPPPSRWQRLGRSAGDSNTKQVLLESYPRAGQVRITCWPSSRAMCSFHRHDRLIALGTPQLLQDTARISESKRSTSP
jgi:hypothetical protein